MAALAKVRSAQPASEIRAERQLAQAKAQLWSTMAWNGRRIDQSLYFPADDAHDLQS